MLQFIEIETFGSAERKKVEECVTSRVTEEKSMRCKPYLQLLTRHYARNVDRRKPNLGGDARYTLMKEALYDESKVRNVPTIPPEELERREVIEKVWAVEQSRSAASTLNDHRKKFSKIHAAMEQLKELDETLYLAANSKSLEPELFPKSLNVYSEVPSSTGFPEYPSKSDSQKSS